LEVGEVQTDVNPECQHQLKMNTKRGGEIRTLRENVATVERRVGGLAVGLGTLALMSFVVFRGTEHRLVVLAIAGLPAVLGGGILVVAGRMLGRPGRLAVMGQALPILLAGYWLLIVGL
jgi:hypothetical protein